jgi:hypothetical protein
MVNLLGFDVTAYGSDADAGFSVEAWRSQRAAGGIPVHVHARTDEGFYVVEGEIALWLDDRARCWERARTSACDPVAATASGTRSIARHLPHRQVARGDSSATSSSSRTAW